MADNTLKTRLLSAYNTLPFWSTCTIVPLSGEVCYGVDDNNNILEIKIGNGVDLYKDLPGFTGDVYELINGTETTSANSVTVNVKMQTTSGSIVGEPTTSSTTINAATTARAGVMTTAQVDRLNKTVTNVSTAAVSGKAFKVQQSKNGTVTDVTPAFGTAATVNYTTSINNPASNSTNLITDYGIKQYVDGQIANATHFCGGFAATGDGTIDGGSTTLKSVAEKVGDMYTVTTAGTYLGITFEVGDSIIFQKAVAAGTAPTTADFITVEGETSVSVVDSNPTLKWGTKTQVGTVEGSALNVTGMPAPKSTSTAVIDVTNNNNQIEIAHKVSGVTSGSYGDGTHVFKATVDSYGHITSATTVKVPSATTGAEGLTKKPSGTAPIAVSVDNVISHNNSGVTAGTYGDSTHVSKVTVDAKGHVTSATTVAIPSATSAAEGLTKKPTGTAPISVSTDNVISHDNSGVTAGTYGAAQTASFAGNVAIPSIKVDAKGHVTTAGTVNVKMPSTAGLGTSAKDIKSVAWQFNTNSGNTANDAKITVTLNDNNTIVSNIITNTLILDGNFTS